MVGRAIDVGLQHIGNTEITIVNGHGPDVDNEVESQIEVFVEWEEECVYVIRGALQETINRMEGKAGIRRWHLPLVMWLVDVFVDERYVQPAMDPVDQQVCEQYEHYDGKPNHPPA